jgi:hypothetical protein
MTKSIQRKLLTLGVGLFAATVMVAGDAHANNFSSIGSNIIDSISQLPSLLAGLAYMFGILLAVLGIMKIKDHVENPGQTPLKDGSIRLAAGGALFAIPIVSDAMTTTIGSGAAATTASLNVVQFQ